MRGFVDRVMRWSPAQPVFDRRALRRLAVLAYHSIDDPASFSQHLDYLKRRRVPVSLEEVVAAQARTTDLPRGAVLVTFDDADRTHLDYAAPMMRERGVPGVAFVVSGLLGSSRAVWTREALALARQGGRSAAVPTDDPELIVRALKRLPDGKRLAALEELRETSPSPAPDWPQLEPSELTELESSGIEVGDHTFTHPCLPSCPNDKIATELAQSRSVLTEALGRPPRAFAYPNGDWDARAVRELSSHRYEVAFLFEHRLARIPVAQPLLMPRVRVNSDDSVDRLRIVLSGLHPAIYHLRGASRIGSGESPSERTDLATSR
jgi:peptidoglycan/xylan/chitin deacetylase (PgdA/CDA1 family)